MAAQVQLSSRQQTPEDLLNTDASPYDFASTPVPHIQIKSVAQQQQQQPQYVLDETLFDLGILQPTQPGAHSGLALNLSYANHQQYGIPQVKEDSLELEDYIQGLNDRFELQTDPNMLPVTPRASFDQGQYFESNAILKHADAALRTDNLISSNFPPTTPQNGFLPSPATSSELTPPHGRMNDNIYTHRPIAGTTTTPLKDYNIPPPFVQKTPMGPVAYNPQLPVFVQAAYTGMSPSHHHHTQSAQHVRTASMADITSSPIVHQRFPTPPLSNQGELLHSPTFPSSGRARSPLEEFTSPERHASPDSEYTSSNYGSPQRRAIPNFDTPPFSPVFPVHLNFAAHLQPRKRGHARGYSTTSIMTNTTFATDASSPPSSSEDDPLYINEGPVKSRGTRRSNVPDSTLASYIAGPDPTDHKFQCLYPECGKRFGRKYNIQSHIQTHLSDRPYRCEVCRAGFVRQHDLRRHEKIHGGDKPFVCLCKKSFARQDALTRHRQRYWVFLWAKSNHSGICIGAFKDAREARELQDSVKQAKGHRRRNSVAV